MFSQINGSQQVKSFYSSMIQRNGARLGKESQENDCIFVTDSGNTCCGDKQTKLKRRVVILFLYRTLWFFATPWIPLWFFFRIRQGKEDPRRLKERYGYAGLPRPSGTLCWVHAISLGESQSVSPLIKRLVRRYPHISILVTTGTITSAETLSHSLPSRAFHQMAPLDKVSVIRRFLNHWKPDIVIRVESEIWPETLHTLACQKIPRAILQARVSESSARFWQVFPGFFVSLLQGFNPIIAQSSEDLQRLRTLGVSHLHPTPLNLKRDIDTLADTKEKLQQIPFGPCWLASNTHPGEEKIILEVHKKIRTTFPNLLTIILPRHPHRGAALESMAKKKGWRTGRRTKNPLSNQQDIYIADTLGETRLFYQLAQIVFMGGSLVPKGGHNLLEPARWGCAIVHGPSIFNQSDVARVLSEKKASLKVQDTPSLSQEVIRLLSQPEAALEMGKRAKQVAQSLQGVTEKVEELLLPLLRMGSKENL